MLDKLKLKKVRNILYVNYKEALEFFLFNLLKLIINIQILCNLIINLLLNILILIDFKFRLCKLHNYHCDKIIYILKINH